MFKLATGMAMKGGELGEHATVGLEKSSPPRRRRPLAVLRYLLRTPPRGATLNQSAVRSVPRETRTRPRGRAQAGRGRRDRPISRAAPARTPARSRGWSKIGRAHV